ncbi:MAG: hypothetical protein IJS28_06505 [Synergistaceae bacterium]|nr:hypothetical protein [Synergistaceae bacterium]
MISERSAGYDASLLMAVLDSCACADNGFGAGYLTGRINRIRTENEGKS